MVPSSEEPTTTLEATTVAPDTVPPAAVADEQTAYDNLILQAGKLEFRNQSTLSFAECPLFPTGAVGPKLASLYSQADPGGRIGQNRRGFGPAVDCSMQPDGARLSVTSIVTPADGCFTEDERNSHGEDEGAEKFQSLTELQLPYTGGIFYPNFSRWCSATTIIDFDVEFNDGTDPSSTSGIPVPDAATFDALLAELFGAVAAINVDALTLQS